MVFGGAKGIGQKEYNTEGRDSWVGLASSFSGQKKPVSVNGKQIEGGKWSRESASNRSERSSSWRRTQRTAKYSDAVNQKTRSVRKNRAPTQTPAENTWGKVAGEGEERNGIPRRKSETNGTKISPNSTTILVQ